MVVLTHGNYLAAISLVATNLIPLFGVAFLGWQAFEVVMVFWLETVILALMLLIKALHWIFFHTDDYRIGRLINLSLLAVPLAFIYRGLGIMLITVLAPEGEGGNLSILAHLLFEANLWPAALGLLATQIFSFIVDYLIGKEHSDKKATDHMVHTFIGRLVLLQLAGMLGIFFQLMMGADEGLLFGLVIMKLYFELILFCKQHPDVEKTLAWLQPNFYFKEISEIDTVKYEPSDRKTYSTGIALIIANMMPLFGVIFFGWTLYSVMMLYWVENVIVALMVVSRVLPWIGKKYGHSIPLMASCLFFFAFVVFVQLVFIVNIFSDLPAGSMFTMDMFSDMMVSGGVGVAALGLFFSHFLSYIVNYIIGREYIPRTYRKAFVPPRYWIVSPFSRSLPIIFVVMIAGVLAEVAGLGLFGIVPLILLKTYLDLYLHCRHHLNVALAFHKWFPQRLRARLFRPGEEPVPEA